MNHHLINTILTKLGVPIITNISGNKFYCPSFLELWRAETLFEKEPETIAWINGFKPESLLIDIGANVGTYTVYAGRNGHEAICFEPSERECVLLEKNIELNQINASVHQTALGDGSEWCYYPCGNRSVYIKIDTDGYEIPIIKSLKNMLPRVRECLIELEPKNHDVIISLMKENGFDLISESIAEMFKGTQYENYRNGIFRRRRVRP